MLANTTIIDPFELKKLSKLHPYRLLFTTCNRTLDAYGKITQKPILNKIEGFTPDNFFPEPGSYLSDTYVTTNQAKLLEMAVANTEHFSEPIVEIGSYRGVTTRQLALATSRLVYAVDPYIGYGGRENDLAILNEKIKSLSNICHLRATSGQVFKQMQNKSFSLVFIDAIHDFANTWFDFFSWSSLVRQGGLIAMHDVDDFPGTNLVCRIILSQTNKYSLWGYCPNLAIVQNLKSA
jgi:predicted O-methyltransferase YrrM